MSDKQLMDIIDRCDPITLKAIVQTVALNHSVTKEQLKQMFSDHFSKDKIIDEDDLMEGGTGGCRD